MKFDTPQQQVICIVIAVLTSLVIRAGIGIHPYSGMGLAPMHGDYEAQRHWMEVTTGLPLNTWYWNTSDNDLLYWGLDYPPLTAYHSWIVGRAAASINTSWVELRTSRGIESPQHKQFMRISVLVTDAVTFLPACLLFFLWALPSLLDRRETHLSPFWALFLLLVQPGLCLVDHGHFQYNCASIGFFVASIACLLKDYDIIGAVLFCLALLYKQMELYHALPIFCYLLGKCISCSTLSKGMLKLIGLGITVCTTLGLVLFPFVITSDNPVDQLKQITHRVFPVARGIYEDKVSNLWCSLSVLIKWNQLIFPHNQIVICAASTFAFCLPACCTLLPPSADLRKRKRQLLYSLIISSLAFFLFSYHVHEKSILLVAVPVAMVCSLEPHISILFGLISTLSMWPLITKDRLALVTLCVCSWFGLVGFSLMPPLRRLHRWLVCAILTGYTVLLVLDSFITPPPRWPHLIPLLISIYSCVLFLATLAYFYWKLIRITSLISKSS